VQARRILRTGAAEAVNELQKQAAARLVETRAIAASPTTTADVTAEGTDSERVEPSFLSVMLGEASPAESASSDAGGTAARQAHDKRRPRAGDSWEAVRQRYRSREQEGEAEVSSAGSPLGATARHGADAPAERWQGRPPRRNAYGDEIIDG